MQQPSVRDFFKDQAQFDAQMSKEQVKKVHVRSENVGVFGKMGVYL